MPRDDIILLATIIPAVAAALQLLEYLFTRNIPWLFGLLRTGWRRLMWRLRRRKADGKRYIVLNFSSHPILPGQKEAIQKRMRWPTLEVISAEVGNVSENKQFVKQGVKYVDQLNVPPEDWPRSSMVVVPAGYSPLWSVIVAELHGRLGYFPDVIHLRPAPSGAPERYELAQIISLQPVRNKARSKR